MLLFKFIVSCAIVSLSYAKNDGKFTSFGALDGSARSPSASKNSRNYNPDCDKSNSNQQSSHITEASSKFNTNSMLTGTELTGDETKNDFTNENSNLNETMTDTKAESDKLSSGDGSKEDKNASVSSMETTTVPNNGNGRGNRNRGRNSRRNRQNQNKNTKIIKKVYIKKIQIAHKG